MKGKHYRIEELMYFPSGKFLKEIAIGYDCIFADFIWLRAIQYFGEHRMTDLKFQYLGHILDVLTTLDPQFVHAYTLGSLLLTHCAKESDRTLTLLDKGMKENPDKWEIPYTKGFIYYIFLRKFDFAVKYFLEASKVPKAPEMCERFAAFVYAKMGERELSIRLWKELYERTKNEMEKETALRYIKRLVMEGHLEDLQAAVGKYKKTFGEYPHSLRDLITANIIDSIPEEPHNGHYYFSYLEKKVKSTGRPTVPLHHEK
ncbi:MAG: hypothetical protein AB1393_07500 [Candidatus Edwardsbacteria bacterium]